MGGGEPGYSPVAKVCFEAYPLALTNYITCTTHLPHATYVQFPLWLGLLIAFTWCISVCLSRIYLGVHSLLVSYTDP